MIDIFVQWVEVVSDARDDWQRLAGGEEQASLPEHTAYYMTHLKTYALSEEQYLIELRAALHIILE